MKTLRQILAVIGVAALFLPFTLRAADAGFYGVVKLHQYQQSASVPPQVLSSNGYSFQAFVVATTNNAVTNATVKPSNTTPSTTQKRPVPKKDDKQ